jgi:hypothetical protein
MSGYIFTAFSLLMTKLHFTELPLIAKIFHRIAASSKASTDNKTAKRARVTEPGSAADLAATATTKAYSFLLIL